VDLVLPAVAGLAAAHRVGIVHRDVKPENLFLASEPLGDLVVKVVDFGISKDLSASGAGAEDGAPERSRHTVAGTPHYMAPEQVRGSGALDGRTDQYALGVLLYQCLTGVRPFEADSLLALACRIDAGLCRPVRELCPELPERLAAVVERAMAPRIEDRFPNTEAFGQALAAFASQELRDAYARDFAPERRSSAPPPRQVATPFLPASCAGWISNGACTGVGVRASLAPAGGPYRAFWTALARAGMLALIVLSLAWRAVGGPPAGARERPLEAVQAGSVLPHELSSVVESGLDFVAACRSQRAR
jgi:serine/threonine-protein kinase